MIEASALPMFLIEPDGTILRQNPAAAALALGPADALALAKTLGSATQPGGARLRLGSEVDPIALETGSGFWPGAGLEGAVCQVFASAVPGADGQRHLVVVIPQPVIDGPEGAIGALAAGLQGASSMSAVGALLCQRMPAIFPNSSGRCYLPGTGGYVMEPTGSWGLPAPEVSGIRAIDCWAFRRGGLHDIGFTDQVKPPCRHMGDENRSYVCVPLKAQGTALGLVHVVFDRLPHAQAERSGLLSLLRQTAESVSLGILRSGLSHLVESQALHDLETGLYSRGFLFEMFAREIIRMTRAGRALTFAVTTPGHLAAIERDHGIEARAAALRDFAETLKTFRKGSDIASRIAPDTFAIVLPDMDVPQAEKRLGSFLAAVQGRETVFRGRTLARATAAVGAAVFPLHGMTTETLLRQAEVAHARAVAAGGNCVRVLPAENGT